MRALFCCLICAMCLLAACGRTPDDPASTIEQSVQQINEQSSETAPGERGLDPLMEEQCKSVSRDQATQLEARLQQERASGQLTVLIGDETSVLACSRYWKKLEGK